MSLAWIWSQNGFGPKDGEATLADCTHIFLTAREMYGVSYNRLTIELAQVPAWAKMIKAGHFAKLARLPELSPCKI